MASYSEEFYKQWAPVAQAESKRSGIPASVILAQGMLESKSGDGSFLSKLASMANNFFGIKADSGWKGKTYSISSNEEVNGRLVPKISSFRMYDSPEQSWIDHTDFLLNNPRYAEAGVFSSSDPAKVAQALQDAGYATSSTYAQTLMNIIEGSKLTQYDIAGLQPIGDPKKAAPAATVGGSSSGSGASGGGANVGNGGIDFGIGSVMGVDLDKLFGNILFLLVGLLFIAAGLFVAFGGTGGVVKTAVKAAIE